MAVSKAEILDAIAGMTVLDLSELIKEMEEKFGVSAAAAAVAVAAPAAGGAAAAEEQTEFTVMPRYSATTTVWAPATCAATSATTAFFSSRFRLKVLPPSQLRSVARSGWRP